MADIFPFQKEQVEEDHCCKACQTTDEYLEIALTCDDKEELRAVLRGLYHDAYTEGFRDALIEDVNVKMQLLDELDVDDDDPDFSL